MAGKRNGFAADERTGHKPESVTQPVSSFTFPVPLVSFIQRSTYLMAFAMTTKGLEPSVEPSLMKTFCNKIGVLCRGCSFSLAMLRSGLFGSEPGGSWQLW